VQSNTSTKAARPRRLHIFVADDDVDTVLMLATILRDEGHVVSTCTNPQIALESIARFKPDVCILDVVMPGKSGFAIAKGVKELDLPKRVVMICVSAIYTKPSDTLLKANGFDYFLQKPAEPKELVNLLDLIAGDDPSPAAA